MKQIKIVIEKSKDHFSSYAENVKGIYGAGDTPEKAKESAVKAIDLLKKYNKPQDIPLILKGEYKIVFFKRRFID
jgi:predicted RNase H-like HicB family nuclease